MCFPRADVEIERVLRVIGCGRRSHVRLKSSKGNQQCRGEHHSGERLTSGPETKYGLVFGYGAVDLSQIRKGLGQLRRSLADSCGWRRRYLRCRCGRPSSITAGRCDNAVAYFAAASFGASFMAGAACPVCRTGAIRC